jgi:hypothetical protein
MADWTAGYITNIEYTFGHYKELNPLHARLALINAGLEPPAFATACELGFGQGISINLHAAASSIKWHGTDFNPTQTAFARKVATASGSGVALFDDDFASFAQRSDLPDFDFIGLHGIWSWISDENRAIIVDFLRRKLSVGGVLYMSYNTQPGWASFAPIRHLMVQHATNYGAAGHGIANRINDARGFIEKLLAVEPAFARANPWAVQYFDTLKTRDHTYLVHEYFNRHWQPMHFSALADWLEPAKLSYVCSANYLDNIDEINITQVQQNFLDGIPDVRLREDVRDFMVNQQFRRDYWVKGPVKLTPDDHETALRSQTVVLVTNRSDVPLKVTGRLGEVPMDESALVPILDLLTEHQARTLGEIAESLASKGISLDQVTSAVIALIGAGHLVAAQDADVVDQARTRTDKLNAFLLRKAPDNKGTIYLASPVTGGGIAIGPYQRLFLLALSQGQREPTEWARTAWNILATQNQQVLGDEKLLASEEETISELTVKARNFAAKRLPMLKTLLVV